MASDIGTNQILVKSSKVDVFMQQLKRLKRHKAIHLMAIPGVVYLLLFKIIPLFGTIIAFQDYNIFTGISGSPFVGLKHFETLFNYAEFWAVLRNTLLIGGLDILFRFPAPIILALLINEIGKEGFKRTIQSIIYVPHFLSWVVVGGIFTTQLLSPETGLINHLISFFGGDPIYFMAEPKYARAIVILAGIWREVGWGTVIYLAALAGIDPNLYEAASIDGASRLRKVFAVTIPSILPVILVLFLMTMGRFLNFGFERIWVFRNGANQEVLEIFDTYIYWFGLSKARFSYATAVGFFKSIVGFLILFLANAFSKKTTGNSLY